MIFNNRDHYDEAMRMTKQMKVTLIDRWIYLLIRTEIYAKLNKLTATSERLQSCSAELESELLINDYIDYMFILAIT